MHDLNKLRHRTPASCLPINPKPTYHRPRYLRRTSGLVNVSCVFLQPLPNIPYLRGWRSADTHNCGRFRLSSLSFLSACPWSLRVPCSPHLRHFARQARAHPELKYAAQCGYSWKGSKLSMYAAEAALPSKAYRRSSSLLRKRAECTPKPFPFWSCWLRSSIHQSNCHSIAGSQMPSLSTPFQKTSVNHIVRLALTHLWSL